MFIPHNYAIQIESIARTAFNECNRSGFGGIADADMAESQPFTVIYSALATYYNNLDDINKQSVDNFITEYIFYSDKSIKEIGEDEIKKIIKELKSLLKDFKN